MGVLAAVSLLKFCCFVLPCQWMCQREGYLVAHLQRLANFSSERRSVHGLVQLPPRVKRPSSTTNCWSNADGLLVVVQGGGGGAGNMMLMVFKQAFFDRSGLLLTRLGPKNLAKCLENQNQTAAKTIHFCRPRRLML